MARVLHESAAVLHWRGAASQSCPDGGPVVSMLLSQSDHINTNAILIKLKFSSDSTQTRRKKQVLTLSAFQFPLVCICKQQTLSQYQHRVTLTQIEPTGSRILTCLRGCGCHTCATHVCKLRTGDDSNPKRCYGKNPFALLLTSRRWSLKGPESHGSAFKRNSKWNKKSRKQTAEFGYEIMKVKVCTSLKVLPSSWILMGQKRPSKCCYL